MASPSAACRPWPTCSGPVGLADTNSTRTFPPLPASLRPNAAPRASTSFTTAKRAPPARVKLMKPGPATSARASTSLAPSAATIASATSRGFNPARLASCSAALVAKSPWAAFFGRSSSTVTASTPGSTVRTAAWTSSARRLFGSGEDTGKGESKPSIIRAAR